MFAGYILTASTATATYRDELKGQDAFTVETTFSASWEETKEADGPG